MWELLAEKEDDCKILLKNGILEPKKKMLMMKICRMRTTWKMEESKLLKKMKIRRIMWRVIFGKTIFQNPWGWNSDGPIEEEEEEEKDTLWRSIPTRLFFFFFLFSIRNCNNWVFFVTWKLGVRKFPNKIVVKKSKR